MVSENAARRQYEHRVNEPAPALITLPVAHIWRDLHTGVQPIAAQADAG